MAVWKQLLLSLVVVALGVVGWARYVPSSLPVLERLGVLTTLTALGVVPGDVPGGAAPSGAAGPGATSSGPPGAPAGATGRPGGGPGGGRGGAGGAARVVAAAPGEGEVNDRVTAIGTGEALRSVSVAPQVSGRLAEVLIGSGQRVAEGDILARLEREAEQIALERALLVLEDARARNARVRRLQASGAASDVQIREADLALRQAELALRQAQFELDRRLVRAPIAGWVGIVTSEAGGQVTSGSEITRIDDRTALLVEFRLPERFVAQVGVGKPVTVRPLAQEDLLLQGRIDAIDNRVDATSRTIRVQARIENADDGLRAGMAFEISVELAGEVYPSVDPLAIQWGREGAFVWVIRAGKAARVPVRIVQRAAGAVLVKAAFEAGDLVIAEGVQRLRPGAAVEAVGASPRGAQAGGPGSGGPGSGGPSAGGPRPGERKSGGAAEDAARAGGDRPAGGPAAGRTTGPSEGSEAAVARAARPAGGEAGRPAGRPPEAQP